VLVLGSPEAAIGRARVRERLARRQAAGLAALGAVGLMLAIWPRAERFGALVAVLAFAGVVVELVVIAVARGQARRAVDDLIDAGVVIGLQGDLHNVVDDRQRVLSDEPSRRAVATALRDALADAGRPRSSNPLILAERSIVLRRGTALALLADRQLVLRIVSALTERPTNPRAVVALRTLLYPQATGPLAVDDQQRQAQHQLRRIADLLELSDETRRPHPSSVATGE
jgi:hypothetical protein